MINLVPITLWELFKTLCTGTVVTEFSNIIFKASGNNFELIQADFNEKIYIADEKSNEVKARKEKKRKSEVR